MEEKGRRWLSEWRMNLCLEFEQTKKREWKLKHYYSCHVIKTHNTTT